MTFIKIDRDGNLELVKPLKAFFFLSVGVGMGILIFTLILYSFIKIITSEGFSELKSTTENGDRERIDDNDDLEDV